MKKASLRVIGSFCVGIFCMVGCGLPGPLYLPEQAKPGAESAKGNTLAKKQSASAAPQAVSSQASERKVSEVASSVSSVMSGASSGATSSK